MSIMSSTLDALGCVPMQIMPRNWRLCRVKRTIVALRLLGGSPKVTKGQGLQGVAACEPVASALGAWAIVQRIDHQGIREPMGLAVRCFHPK